MKNSILRKTLFVLVLSTFISGLVLQGGCSWISGKKGDKDKKTVKIDTDPSRLIEDYAAPSGMRPAEVLGFGLVVNLNGTGCVDKKSVERDIVYNEMRNNPNVKNVNELFSSKTTAVVRIRAMIPGGAHSGEILDAEVMFPPGSEAESLQGGYLLPTTLQDLQSGGGTIRKGRAVARVEGPIILSPSAKGKSGIIDKKQGRILGGVKLKESRLLVLVIKEDKRSYFAAKRIEEVINQRFFLPERNKGVATAKTPELVELAVHPSYKNSIPRYLKVVQSIAMFENDIQKAERIKRLEKELLNLESSENAAFQLEAIGSMGVKALKTGLACDNPLIRFYSATSLAFLNCTEAAGPLAGFARNDAAFRFYALEALGTMKDDFDADNALSELLDEPSIETRYGAFHALVQKNPHDMKIRGENMSNQFNYHVISTKASPFIHLTFTKKPEIVLFGQDIALNHGFVLEAGNRIIVRSDRPGETIVKRIGPDINETQTVSSRLDDVIRSIVELGGAYPDVVQFLTDARDQKILPCKIEIDKLPKTGRVYRRTPTPDEADDAEKSTNEKAEDESLWTRLTKSWQTGETPEED